MWYLATQVLTLLCVRLFSNEKRADDVRSSRKFGKDENEKRRQVGSHSNSEKRIPGRSQDFKEKEGEKEEKEKIKVCVIQLTVTKKSSFFASINYLFFKTTIGSRLCDNIHTDQYKAPSICHPFLLHTLLMDWSLSFV